MQTSEDYTEMWALSGRMANAVKVVITDPSLMAHEKVSDAMQTASLMSQTHLGL